jgi:hypothetical protein
LNLPLPEPLRARPIQWIVVTPENAQEVFKQLESKGMDPVLFTLTDDGYQVLAITMGEIRNFINSQRQIINEYKNYYETPATKKPTKPEPRK